MLSPRYGAQSNVTPDARASGLETDHTPTGFEGFDGSGVMENAKLLRLSKLRVELRQLS
jgi:hypothetical protein